MVDQKLLISHLQISKEMRQVFPKDISDVEIRRRALMAQKLVLGGAADSIRPYIICVFFALHF